MAGKNYYEILGVAKTAIAPVERLGGDIEPPARAAFA